MQKIISTFSVVLLALAIAFGHANAAEILEIGPEEYSGMGLGVRPSIDVDSKGQPHILTDTGHPAGLGGEIYIAHRIGGVWTASQFATRTSETVGATPSSITQPWIEIDENDRAWIFVWYFLSDVMPGCGQGVWLYDNMSTAPRKLWFHKKQYGIGWTPGNIQIDPFYPDRSVVMTRDGAYGVIDTAGTTIATGQMGPTLSGEKFRFRITPREGQPGVWHGVMNGYSRRDSSYHNNLINRDVVWADYQPYASQGDDHNHAGVCGDLENPALGYMAAVFKEAGLCINIWNGSSMTYPISGLKVLDPNARFRHRVPPAMASAFGGGFWIAWCDDVDDHIELAHVAPDGTVVSQQTVTAGEFPAINTDADGNIHMAYMRDNATRYRKIVVSAPGRPFYGEVDLGGSWFWNQWLGYYYKGPERWLYHMGHGWVRYIDTGTELIWIWSQNLGWSKTSPELYPNLYNMSYKSWIRYALGTSGPRWFYIHKDEKWISLD